MTKTTTTMAQNFKKVTHCIFDMDGLILDTEKLYTKATQSILDKYTPGKIYTFDVKVTLMGLQNRNSSQKIVDTYDLPLTWSEYSKLQKEANKILMVDAELLPDTEHIYEEITRQIARGFGKTYPHDVRLKIMGTTDQRSAEIAVNDLELPITVNEYLSRYHKMCHNMLGNVSLLKGAERLLRHLHAHQVPFCLATSSGAEMVDIKTTHHMELFKLFHHRICGSSDPEVKEGKPSPDIFLIAAKRFPDKPDPEKCLVFEDAPNGVRAATAAGMQSIMVPDEHVPAEMCTLATKVLKSLEDFKPEEFGLPPFK